LSTYITSDLHGDYYRFIKMLKAIDFDDKKDSMYILGDVLDRGKYGIKLLNYIRSFIEKGCMYLIKGNHELFAEMYLTGRLKERTWSLMGGESTIEELSLMSYDEKGELLDYLKGLEYYIEYKINGVDCVLTHSGISANFLIEDDNGQIDVVSSIKQAVAYNEFDALISNDIHYISYDKLKRLNKYVIVGHTPVMRLNNDNSYHILKNKYYMDIDTGAGHRKSGGKMSCIRIEDMKEYYM